MFVCFVFLFLVYFFNSKQITLHLHEYRAHPAKPSSPLFHHILKIKENPQNLTELKICLLKSYIEEESAHSIYWLAKYNLYGFPEKKSKFTLERDEERLFCDNYTLKSKTNSKKYKRLIEEDSPLDFSYNATKSLSYFLEAHRLGHKDAPAQIFCLIQLKKIFNNFLDSETDFFYQYPDTLKTLLIISANRGSTLGRMLLLTMSILCRKNEKNENTADQIINQIKKENRSEIEDFLLPFQYCPSCQEVLSIGFTLATESINLFQAKGGEGAPYPSFEQTEAGKYHNENEEIENFNEQKENEEESLKIEVKSEIPKDEVFMIKRAAEMGNQNAQMAMGESYFFGNPSLGVNQDYAQAQKYFEMAGGQNVAKAYHNLGLMNTHGFGVEKNYTKAIEYFEKSLNLGSNETYSGLGYLYYNGYGVQKNITKAIEYYKRVIDSGENAEAEANLGGLYVELANNDKSIQKKKEYHEQAAKYMMSAAKKKHQSGMYNLVVLYLKGVKINATCWELVDYMLEIVLKNDLLNLTERSFNYWKSGKIMKAFILSSIGGLIGYNYHIENIIFILKGNFNSMNFCKDPENKLCLLPFYYNQYLLNREDKALELGDLFFYNSTYLNKNYKLSFQFYRALFDIDPHAMYSLSYMYENGLGTEKNASKSNEILDDILKGVREGRFEVENLWPVLIVKARNYVVNSWVWKLIVN